MIERNHILDANFALILAAHPVDQFLRTDELALPALIELRHERYAGIEVTVAEKNDMTLGKLIEINWVSQIRINENVDFRDFEKEGAMSKKGQSQALSLQFLIWFQVEIVTSLVERISITSKII